MSDSGMKEIWEIYVNMENIENLIFIDFLSDLRACMPKNSSQDFIERLIFCMIWYCYMKEKIFCSWLVYLNLQKKIYFALF